MQRIRREYEGRIRFAYRQFPLTQTHPAAERAAQAAYCAGKQGQLFAYGDLLFKNQDALAPEDLKRYAVTLDLHPQRFLMCFESPATTKAIKEDQVQGVSLGVRFTPTIFVNRIKIEQALSYEELKQVIEGELTKEK